MKPTVGRIIHTRVDCMTRAAIIIGCDPLSDDTRNGPVPVTEVRVLLGDLQDQHRYGVTLHDTEATAGDGDFYWPERTP